MLSSTHVLGFAMTTPRANNAPESASRSFDPGPLAQDITDRIQVDGALRASSDRLQKASDFNQVVMANMGEGLYALNAQASSAMSIRRLKKCWGGRVQSC